MAKSVQDLAGEMSEQFTTGKRDGSGDTYYFLKDGAPEWMKNVCFEAHKDGSPGPFSSMLPDDHRYEMISDAVNAISEFEDEDEARDDLQNRIPVYTAQLTAWLASNVNRPGYCDEAVSEGLTDGSDIVQNMSLGYLREMEEVFAQVHQALTERVEELEAEESAIEDAPEVE